MYNIFFISPATVESCKVLALLLLSFVGVVFLAFHNVFWGACICILYGIKTQTVQYSYLVLVHWQKCWNGDIQIHIRDLRKATLADIMTSAILLMQWIKMQWWKAMALSAALMDSCLEINICPECCMQLCYMCPFHSFFFMLFLENCWPEFHETSLEALIHRTNCMFKVDVFFQLQLFGFLAYRTLLTSLFQHHLGACSSS